MSVEDFLSKAATTPVSQFASNVRAHPFVKWAGGKRSLVPEILQVIPDSFDNYYEPFVGGGALFFALESRMSKAFLSDANPVLMMTYKAIKEEVEAVIKLLRVHASKHNEQYFKLMRKRKDDDYTEAAARLIYLNKTCYNGLYRVNSKGVFNTPMGSYKNPTICDEDNLRQASEALQKASVRWGGFDEIEPNPNDLVYCDPPYDGTYNGYTSLKFNGAEQKLLAKKANEWRKTGATVIVSNSDTELIRKLFSLRKWEMHRISAPRTINCKGGGPKADHRIVDYQCELAEVAKRSKREGDSKSSLIVSYLIVGTDSSKAIYSRR